MDKKEMERMIEINKLSYGIMEDLFLKKDYKNKKELMAEAKKAVKLSNEDKEMKVELKFAYAEAYKKLDNLTWKECKMMKNLILENKNKEDVKSL